MEEMSCVVKGKPILVIRPTQATDFLFALIQAIRNIREMVGRTEAGQSGSDNHDHAVCILSRSDGTRTDSSGLPTSSFFSNQVAIRNARPVAPAKIHAVS